MKAYNTNLLSKNKSAFTRINTMTLHNSIGSYSKGIWALYNYWNLTIIEQYGRILRNFQVSIAYGSIVNINWLI